MPYIGRFARVAPDVVVPEHAVIRGRAIIETQQDLFVDSPVPGAWITAHRDEQIGVRVVRKFHHGPMPEYEARFETCCEGDPVLIQAYRRTIDKIKAHFNL